MNIAIANIASEVCCTLFLMTLFAALLYKRERSRSLYYIELIFVGEIVALTSDLIFRMLSLDRPIAIGLYIDYVISFCASVFLVCSFTFYFYTRFEEKGMLRISSWLRWGVLLYSGLLILTFISSIWTGWLFYLDTGRRLVFTEYYVWTTYLFVPLIVYDFLIILRHRKVLGNAETAVLLLYCVLPIVALFIDNRYNTVCAHIALTLDACMLYTFIYAEQEQSLARSRQELAEMHLNSMVHQINPHFIHNTLSSIESLGRRRPEEASKLLSAFSDYLADNYVDLTKDPLIPFEKELKHVENYLAIEKVRFPNLTVVYDIQAGGFDLPCLSIQPLAENAVKHGICRKRRSEGTLLIASEETEDAFLIRVEDDGAGFDPQKPADGSRQHVGIENVTKRLELLCDGTLTIRSEPGVGTKCEIKIPKGGDSK
ncbi:MAG: histidine kinase [Clostridia bacterium]|nr:histidine kinase [Clostridia bacterium]